MKLLDSEVESLLQEFRSRIHIGKIVSVYDSQHPEYSQELFFVIGFQQDIDGEELVVALMDREYKTFLTPIDNIILKNLLTIDDMFCAKVLPMEKSHEF